KIERRLLVERQPVDVTVDMVTTEGGLRLVAGIEREGQFRPIEKPVTVLTHSPAWVILDDVVAQLQNPNVANVLDVFPLQIPAADVGSFREQFFPRLAETLPLRGQGVEWQEVRAEPKPRLYLR